MNHMNLAKTTVVIVSILSFGGIAVAQQCKVALVNMDEVIMESNESKAAAAKFDARVAEWRKKMNPIQQELDSAQKKLNGKSAKTPEETNAVLNKKIQEKTAELNRIKDDAIKDVDAYRGSLLTSIKASAMEIANWIAAQKGIASVVDSSSPTTTAPNNGAATDCDITAELKTRMNTNSSPADQRK